MKKLKRVLRSVFTGLSRPSGEIDLPLFLDQLDYPVRLEPRYGYEKPPHEAISQELKRQEGRIAEQLRSFLSFEQDLLAIPDEATAAGAGEPFWNNPFLPVLDALALYSLIASHGPRTFLEIGSGHSTRFARRAIRDHGLSTRIVSIDPTPRSEIDPLCDEVIRSPVEEMGGQVLARLEEGDILFVDGSHRVLMNSDCTAVFLDILPVLPPGVLVHFHDIYLPNDYPPEWVGRLYSEQYLLAALLLTAPERIQVLLPNFYVTHQPDLLGILRPLLDGLKRNGLAHHGESFWLRLGEGAAREGKPDVKTR